VVIFSQNFELQMVGKVVSMISNCVDRMKANGVAAAGDFSMQIAVLAPANDQLTLSA
jgi:hypothetical protein